MKTVKFKDLPKRVQVFINRVFEPVEKTVSADAEIDLEWLHTLSKWSKATDDELLEYAGWRYPKGTKGIDYYGNMFVSEWNPCVIGAGGEIYVCDGGAVWFENKWAEIIEEPDALTKAKQALHDHIQCNPEKVKQDLDIMRDLSNEFKAGDEVQYCFDEPNSWGSGIYIGKHGELFVVWTGLKYVSTTEIRKPDPDAKLKEIASEIIANEGLLFTQFENFVTGLSNDRLKKMLIEMGKRIEALKKGKEL